MPPIKLPVIDAVPSALTVERFSHSSVSDINRISVGLKYDLCLQLGTSVWDSMSQVSSCVNLYIFSIWCFYHTLCCIFSAVEVQPTTQYPIYNFWLDEFQCLPIPLSCQFAW